VEKRLFFVFGDLLTNLVIGGCAALLVSLAVPQSWGMFVGMLAGMVLGMLFASLLSFLFIPFFGAMEVMIPAMTTGMLSGMVAGHLAATYHLSEANLLCVGSVLGATVVAVTYALNAFLKGEATDQWMT